MPLVMQKAALAARHAHIFFFHAASMPIFYMMFKLCMKAKVRN